MITMHTILFCIFGTFLSFAISEAALTKEEKQLLLNAHNYLRSNLAQNGDSNQPSSSDMAVMAWSDEAAAKAQKWAESCVAGHDSNNDRKYGNHWWVGQNWAGASYKPAIYEGIKWWYNEIKDFSYETNRCGGVCGHYTQIVWSKSVELGCGVADCSGRGGYRYNLVCNYGPGGNLNGARPYASGTSCSKCPQGLSHCRNGLCSASSSPDVSASGISNKIVPQSWSEVNSANIGDTTDENTTDVTTDSSGDSCEKSSANQSTRPTFECTNVKSDRECNHYARNGLCQSGRYGQWMKKNCQKSCRFC